MFTIGYLKSKVRSLGHNIDALKQIGTTRRLSGQEHANLLVLMKDQASKAKRLKQEKYKEQSGSY